MDSVLLVEDKAELREMLATALGRMGYTPFPVADVKSATAALDQQRFSAVLTDLRLPQGSGMDVMHSALALDPHTPVIVMTAYGSIEDAVAAMRDGAYDFIQKPIMLDHLQHLLARAIERTQLLRENVMLREEYSRRLGFPRIVGEHPLMQEAARNIQRVAPGETPVLLLGESGTGKELFARAIHHMSPRASRPFLAVNCSVPQAMLHDDLFGQGKGARRPGKIESANGGTLFLDEVAELPQEIQATLLRLLEEKRFEHSAGREMPIDVRIIAASARDLDAAAEAGTMRQDLLYRLGIVPIRIPRLSQRGEDVVLLAEHFLERFRREFRKPQLHLSPDAVAALRNHRWPGNVRELQNVIERVAILNETEIHAADLALSANVRSSVVTQLPKDTPLLEMSAQAVRDLERAKIETTLRECKWNRSAAAERLGISYKTLLNKLKSYGLN